MAAAKTNGAEGEEHADADLSDVSDDEEVLEESPCGRWQKRREEVQQRDVPGIDCAFLAMDTEEGVEVVWNEVYISEKKSSKSQLDKIKQVFDNLIQLDHANIVKFHKYWTDTITGKPRVIFITEYMSSGSLKQFLKKTKKSNKTLKSWKRWCTQILSALSYLHSCDPPIIHGNLTCDTIFIQHNGLIKIGSVAPDAIYHHVKTYRKEEARNFHYVAPECAASSPVTTAVDIYSFGMCALEMAVLGIPGNGDTGHHITEERITKTLESLEESRQKDFISLCLEKDPNHRPSARDLLFHAVLFEVHSLKLLAAHTFVKNSNNLPENVLDSYRARLDAKEVIAEVPHKEDSRDPIQFRANQAPNLELEKFLEDVRNGIYPLTAFALTQPPQGRARPNTPEVAESVKSESPEPTDTEMRMVVTATCLVKNGDEAPNMQLTILLRMDDRMNRQLSCEFSESDTSYGLADELVHYGFINPTDRDKLASLIDDHIKNRSSQLSPPAQQLISATS